MQWLTMANQLSRKLMVFDAMIIDVRIVHLVDPLEFHIDLPFLSTVLSCVVHLSLGDMQNAHKCAARVLADLTILGGPCDSESFSDFSGCMLRK